MIKMRVNHGKLAFYKPISVLICCLAFYRLYALLTEAENQQNREKMNKWKDWRDKLNSKHKKIRGKFNKVKGQGIPKEPKKVQQQLELTRVSYMSDTLKSVHIYSQIPYVT